MTEDKGNESSDERTRTTEFPEAAGKIIQSIQVYVTADNFSANINFTDNTALILALESSLAVSPYLGDWATGDCKVLQIYFHTPANHSLLEANYVVVPVNIGRYDENLDIAARYGIPLARGVPALAVLDSSGQLVYSQRNAEFEAMGKVDPTAVTAFLLQWKG